MCWGPAQAYGIANKGRLLEGWDADMTLVDLDQVVELHNDDVFCKAGWSPYEGWALSGLPQYTIVGGRVVYDRGEIRPGVLGKPLVFQA